MITGLEEAGGLSNSKHFKHFSIITSKVSIQFKPFGDFGSKVFDEMFIFSFSFNGCVIVGIDELCRVLFCSLEFSVSLVFRLILILSGCLK